MIYPGPSSRRSALAVIQTNIVAPPHAGEVVEPPRLKRVVRGLAANLSVSVLAPAVVFCVGLVAIGTSFALLAALAWCLGALVWRWLSRRPVSAMLVLAAVILTARTVAALASGSTYVYFVQPVVSDLVIATVFLISLATAKPVVSRLAWDFYPMNAEIARRPRIKKLFWMLTLLWAVVLAGKAVITFWLLHSQPLLNFVVLKNVVLLVATALAVTATVAASVYVARSEGLLHRGPRLATAQ